MKGYVVFYLRLNYHEHKIFGPPYFCVFRVIHEPFLKIVFNTVIILEEYGGRLSESPREDPSHFPSAYCRQRSNMETDTSLNTLPTCPTISSKHFQLECRMKGHLHSRMEVLPQPVDILGIKVMFSLGLRKYF